MPKIPRFTPDPAPEGLDPPLAEWLQRQLNRIEDWWPKDLEDRLAYLESLFPYLVGVWPIIGQSQVQFQDVQVVQTIAVCDQSVGYDSGSIQAANNIYNIDYSESLGYIAISGDGNTNNTNGMIVFRESDGGRVYTRPGCTRAGHKIISAPGTTTKKWLAFLEWPCGGSTRTLYYLDMENAFSVEGALNLGSNNCTILGERDQDVMLNNSTDPTRYYVSTKGTGAVSSIFTPSGWTGTHAGVAINPGGGVADRYLLCMEDGAQFGFSQWVSGTPIDTPTVFLGDIGVGGPGTPSVPLGNGIVVGSSVWWLFLVSENTGNPRTYLVETDFNGNQLQSVPQFDTETYYNSRFGHNRIQYQASNNSIYYTYQEVLWRYSLTNQTYHTCDAPIDPLFTAIQDGRSSSFVRVGNNHWDAIIAYDAGTKWGYEKIESGF